MSHLYTNKLINETSPYLLQHAHNPVNWYPWGDEALQLAKEQDKPLLVSIGYAACHWCHVMERESFEDADTAGLMNKLFVNIKIDREERPDLDHIFMDALQAMQGHGGWPLNIFLTPDGKPFYGGTYFPPVKAFNRVSWKDVLTGVSQAFREKRSEIESQAEQLTLHLEKANSFGQTAAGNEDFVSGETLQTIADTIMKSADKQWGGFGQAPKFPQSFVIRFLLRYYHTEERGRTDNDNPGSAASVYLKQALLSIDKMIDGGIYDQLGGGFARYSTDSEWLVPHFEKMLYDNAILLSVIGEAYQLTGNERYLDVIRETIAFVQRELMHKEGGFFSAIDADSEGEEGRFYTWQYEEVISLLGKDGEVFCEFFDIKPEGNWHEGKPGEKKNIPWRQQTVKAFCREKNIDEKYFNGLLEKGRQILFSERGKRIRPMTDDKVLLGWNALMNSSLSKSFEATGIEAYRKLAVSNMEFLLRAFVNEEGEYFHSWKNGIKKHPAFLDDLAFLIQALIHLQEITGETAYLLKAKELAELLIREYKEESTAFFFYTRKSQKDVLVRKKEIYDGATPSGNAVMAENLLKLSVYFDIHGWKTDSLKMIQAVGQALTSYPVSFGFWSCILLFFYKGIDEIVIMGSDYKLLQEQLLRVYLPHKILHADHVENEAFPLLQNKMLKNKTAIYLCRNYSCQKPVFTIEDLLALLKPK